ncbi:MAG: chromosome condensation protein CcrB [Gammaproteobacteria bacterium]|jgi:CrcB protein|nr:chromosome condensation protein CcrB [Gammaproteobacteria bacterium]
MNLMNLLLVFFGGALGSVARYSLTCFSITRWPQMIFPVGTFAVNLIGSFLIGLFSVYFVQRWPHVAQTLRLFFMVGILGGFTTFSSLSLETVSLLYEGEGGTAFIYILASVAIGLLAAWLGIMLGKFFYA